MKIPKILSELAHPAAKVDPDIQRERFSANVEGPRNAWEKGGLDKWYVLAKTMPKLSGHEVKQLKPRAPLIENNPLIPQHPTKHKKH